MTSVYKTLALLVIIISLLAIPACELLKNATGISKDLKNLTYKIDSVSADSILLKDRLDALAFSTGQNVALGIRDKADSISLKLITGFKGVFDTLDPDIKKLMSDIDKIGNLTDAQILKMGNTLDNQLTRLKGNIKDESLKIFILNMVEEVTGKLNNNTKNLLSNMITSALETLESESTKRRLNAVIDSLLNDANKQKAGMFLRSVLQPSIDTIMLKIDKVTQKDIPFIQKQASNLLLLIGGIALAIIGFIWYQRMKYVKLIKVLTTQIELIPEQKEYDKLTKNIRKQTLIEGVEPLLRSILKDQGNNDKL